MPAVARPLARQSQTLRATLENKGRSYWLLKRRGTHFGARRNHLNNEERNEITPSPKQSDGDTLQSQVVSSTNTAGLK